MGFRAPLCSTLPISTICWAPLGPTSLHQTLSAHHFSSTQFHLLGSAQKLDPTWLALQGHTHSTPLLHCTLATWFLLSGLLNIWGYYVSPLALEISSVWLGPLPPASYSIPSDSALLHPPGSSVNLTCKTSTPTPPGCSNSPGKLHLKGIKRVLQSFPVASA